ncbi:MAG: hypothetical protein IIC02_11310 [Planctomycetes bacterium]|nr:hypothetical protein [Planctomycetota bacterium]
MLVKNAGLLSLSALAVLMFGTESAQALTPDFVVQYNLRETPGDPLSDVTHRVIIGLFEDSRNGDNVGWEAAILTIHELDEIGNVAYRWSKGYPTVDTTDGLWWIEHADPDNPVMKEFMLPPRIYGTALALDPGVSDLDFDIAGNVYIEPPGGAPFENTGSLNSFLQLAETPPPAPEKDVDDEEIEIPDQPESPYPS